MRNLLLIRHAQTRPLAGAHPADFPLTDEGRASCVSFAETLIPWNPSAVVTSAETKAQETGAIIARTLGLPLETVLGLEEHHRGAVETLGSQAGFEKAVERVFDRPDRVVYGAESAVEALARFSGAIDGILRAYPEGNVAVVTHGTVMALFVAAHNAVEGKVFWRGLKMPDLVVLGLPGFSLQPS